MNIPDQLMAPSQNPPPIPSSGNRFTTTYGSNIPNGFCQMANPPCVIPTRRASGNCSTLSRERDPMSLSREWRPFKTCVFQGWQRRERRDFREIR